MITATDLTKRYGPTTAVDHLSFSVRPGHVTGFLGPNGAGKSTTMRMMLGLDAPTSGRITIDGRHYSELSDPLRSIGALLDPKAVDPRRSAGHHLEWMAVSNGIPRSRVEEVLGLVGLADDAGRRVGGFSLGMNQRLGLAAALLGDPETLVFDEPINGLDPEGILWIRGLLRALADEGRTVFLSSHLMSEMAQTADHLIVIGRGRLIADSSMADLLAAHAHSHVTVKANVHEDQLARVLQRSGGASTVAADGRLVVTGLSSALIGELATANGIALSELIPQESSLEDAFFELTNHDTDHRSSLTGITEGATR